MRFVDNVACAREIQIALLELLSIATNIHLPRASDTVYKSYGYQVIAVTGGG
jgi:hypothetical protein